MRAPTRRSAFLAAGIVLALGAAAGPVLAGPPWVSIELPANPLDPTIRGAFLSVRSYHHQTQTAYPVIGRAIGMVDGRRRTYDLTLSPTGTPGLYAVRRTWPATGTWVLTFNVGGSEGPTAIVGVGPDGEVHSVKVPRRSPDQPWGRPVTDRDIDSALQSLAAAHGPLTTDAGFAGAALTLPVLVLAARRRR